MGLEYLLPLRRHPAGSAVTDPAAAGTAPRRSAPGVARGLAIPAILGCALAIPARAAEPATASAWEYALYKTLTYETLANTTDILILNALNTGATALGTAFLAVDMASAAAAYYTHEIAWMFMGPAPEERTAATTGTKAISYRLISLARGYGLAYAYVGNASIATTYTILAGITHTALYVGNDWAWNTYAPPPPRVVPRP